MYIFHKDLSPEAISYPDLKHGIVTTFLKFQILILKNNNFCYLDQWRLRLIEGQNQPQRTSF